MKNSLLRVLLMLAMTILSACNSQFSVEQPSALVGNIDDGLGDTDGLPSQNCITVKASWTVPTTREDGQALPSTEIGSYKLYLGLKSGQYDQQHVTNNFEITLTGLETNRNHYFAVTAIDKNGLESKYSEEVVVKSDKCSTFVLNNNSSSIDPVSECKQFFTNLNILPTDQVTAICSDVSDKQLKCMQESLSKNQSMDALFETCPVNVSYK